MEENVIMPLSCTRQEIAGIGDLLAALRRQPEPLAAAGIDFAALEQLYLVGSGDSWAVALMVERYLAERGMAQCRAVQSFAFLTLPRTCFNKNTLVVAISASGRPSPVLEALAYALTTEACAVGITNAPGSPFSSLTPRMMFTHASKRGFPTQSSAATLLLLIALADNVLQAKSLQAAAERSRLNIAQLSRRWENARWQRWLATHAGAFFSRRVVFLGSGIGTGMAYLAANLLACGPQIEAGYFHLEEYCHALRLNQADSRHLVLIMTGSEADNALCASVEQRLTRQGALCWRFARAEDDGTHDYLQQMMLLLFHLALRLAERYVATGGKRITFGDRK